MIAGEERLKEKAAGDPQRLSRMLGLSERVKAERASVELPEMKKAEEVLELKPGLKRRVGLRKSTIVRPFGQTMVEVTDTIAPGFFGMTKGVSRGCASILILKIR